MSPEALQAAFGLTDRQLEAATADQRDVVVTAGAGTGKTRTLVARYLWLLSGGRSPRQVAAITFTEKAAREMRNRAREAVAVQARRPTDQATEAHWQEVASQMDAARIGTIHALCAEVIRTHPAEAEVDPAFEVIDEGWALAVKSQVIDDSLAWAIGQSDVAPLFADTSVGDLRRVLSDLLARRLDAAESFSAGDLAWSGQQAIGAALDGFLWDPAVEEAVERLRQLRSEDQLRADAGPKLGAQVEALLDAWEQVVRSHARGEMVEAARDLFQIRRTHMDLRSGGQGSQAKLAVTTLRQRYADLLAPWLGGESNKDQAPSVEVEAKLEVDLPRLRALFEFALDRYRVALDTRGELDFDDLESMALRLLRTPELASHWQAEVSHVLVDEFQDTNPRQRLIVESLAGGRPGSLFVVGDARQSIYGFRGADVSVFRRLDRDLQRQGGLAVDLKRTFRSHAELLGGIDDLLIPVMGVQEMDDLYEVPYTRLESAWTARDEALDGPHVEFVLGLGERAEDARPNGARALAARLLALQADSQIKDWSEVALLFRASTAFDDYESALEAAGIPFVTVAGRGFYDRPEIRDALNLLRALADPADDLALAGFLRSPAVGLTDSALFKLRTGADGRRALHEALSTAQETLEGDDRDRAEFGLETLNELGRWVDRLAVDELLKRTIDRLDLRAVLATSHSRMWRNLDKLLEDARTSQLVRLREFLDYLQTLRDVGAREGEAPSDVRGAVRLMTVHKAKGLEFEVVVIADAGRQPRISREPCYVFGQTGVAFRMDRLEGDSMLYRLAQSIDRGRSEAEERRLLYVAATRARRKLVVAGHLTTGRGGPRAAGWLADLLAAAGVDIGSLSERSEPAEEMTLPGGQPLGLWIGQADSHMGTAPPVAGSDWPSSGERSLVAPITQAPIEEAEQDLDEGPSRDWRATGDRPSVPAAALGRIVHMAIQRGWTPESDAFEPGMEYAALREGLVDDVQRKAAVAEARRLLARLAAHPVWAEIAAAEVVYHELPFTTPAQMGGYRSGVIDLLYHTAGAWHLIDFKTDELRSEAELAQAVEKHTRQIQGYRDAVRRLMKVDALPQLCFLDASGQVQVVQVR